jgi:hypothetical protein
VTTPRGSRETWNSLFYDQNLVHVLLIGLIKAYVFEKALERLHRVPLGSPRSTDQPAVERGREKAIGVFSTRCLASCCGFWSYRGLYEVPS